MEMSIQIDNVNGQYYDNLIQQLRANGNSIIHPRTREIIDSCTDELHPKGNAQHLARFPTVAYHRKKNQVCLTPVKVAVICYCDIQGDYAEVKQLVAPAEFNFRKTAQFKTIWYSKGKRRM